MNDDWNEPPEDPLIDVRSPGERWAESGRAGFERARGLVESGRIDVAALSWMLLIVLLTALQIYSALRVSGIDDGPGNPSEWWVKAELLSGSGGIVLIFGSVIGVFLAAWSDRPPARLALRVAFGAGVWAMFAGLLAVAVAIHSGDGNLVSFARVGTEAKIVSTIGALCYAGLGLLVAVVAAVLVSEVDAHDPELAELS